MVPESAGAGAGVFAGVSDSEGSSEGDSEGVSEGDSEGVSEGLEEGGGVSVSPPPQAARAKAMDSAKSRDNNFRFIPSVFLSFRFIMRRQS